MAAHATHLDKSFLAFQKERLLKLRHELESALSSAAADERDETAINSEAREAEDDAQKLAALELDGLQERRQRDRLESVARALQKIENGSYGISTVSGKPIPRARLEAVPEALWDVGEKPE